MRKVTHVHAPGQTVPARDASLAELVAKIDAWSDAIHTMTATVDLEPTAGSVYSGVIKEYHDVKGFVLLQRPSTIRLLGQAPWSGRIGGHGSRPEAGKDPIVLAAEFVMVAQTIVSRQIDPQQPAVLTVGTIHGGTKYNIIPDEVTMGMTLRTYSVAERDQIVAAVRRTANGLAEAYGIPADRMPTVNVIGAHR